MDLSKLESKCLQQTVASTAVPAVAKSPPQNPLTTAVSSALSVALLGDGILAQS